MTEIFSLEGRTATVIGGSGVLGGRFCEVLSAAGARVAVLGTSEERTERVAARLRQRGGEALALQCDVTQLQEVASAEARIAASLGGTDILVNAPGVNSPTPFWEIDLAEWERILAVNLTGVFLACQVFSRGMAGRGRGGSIVNISSASSEIPLSRVLTYSVSKAGVDSLTRWLGRELAPHRIRVNALAPGFFPAEQNRRILSPERVAAVLGHTAMGRLGEPSELDGALLYLASERASGFVTGTVLRVDGGFTAMTI